MIQQKDPKSLNDVNRMLKAAGISAIDGACMSAMTEKAPRERIVTALNMAPRDAQAKTWLIRLITAANHSASSGPQQGENTASAPATPREPSQPRSASAPVGASSRPPQQQSRPPATQAPSREQDSQAASRRSDPPANTNGSAQREFLSFKAYGGKAALSFEADETRQGDPTIAIDGAPATEPRKYDWGRKIRIQLTTDELMVFTAVMYGLLPSADFKNHGPQNNKGFSIQRQQGKFFAKVMQSGDNSGMYAVPIEPADAFQISTLCVRQMRKNYPWMGSNDIVTALRAVLASLMLEKTGSGGR